MPHPVALLLTLGTFAGAAPDGAILRVDWPAVGPDAETAALAALAPHAAELGLDGMDLRPVHTWHGLLGDYVRLRQHHEGWPVFDGEVIVRVKDGAATALTLAPQRHLPSPDRRITDDQAWTAALDHLGLTTDRVTRHALDEGLLGSLPGHSLLRLKLTEGPHDWQVWVDAVDGRVLLAEDRSRHATGYGRVFDPNPIASSGSSQFHDYNDNDQAVFTPELFQVELPRLDGSGYLRGTWVDAMGWNRAQRSNLTFDYPRSNDHFEEVMAYFHLDRTQDYLQFLGFTDVNAHQQVVLVNRVQDDDSWFAPWNLTISTGTGGVDDAEDADVLVHEYGHAMQEDMVPGLGGYQGDALGEGFGDYWSGAVQETVSAQVGDPACFAEWDASDWAGGNPPCMRRLDSTAHAPEHATGGIYKAGTIWASALWTARATLGTTMDAIVIEHHGLIPTYPSVPQARDAVELVAEDIGGAPALDAVHTAFIWQGLSDEVEAPSPLFAVIDSDAVAITNPRTNGKYASKLDDIQVYTWPGADALRLHFVGWQIESGYDHLYLYDGDHRLYQVITGSKMDRDSVVIPGDTVIIRLVSDGDIERYGYDIDRVDRIGPTP